MKESTKKKLRETIFFKPDLYVFVNIAIAVAANLIGFFGARTLNLPLWLDTIGTMMIAIAYGPLAGAIAALLSSSFIIISLGLPLPIYFIGLFVSSIIGFMFPRKREHDLFNIVTLAMIVALATSLLSFPINIIFNNGYPGNLWGDQLYMMISKNVSSKEVCAYMSVAFIDFPDRLLSLLLAFTLFEIATIHNAKMNHRSKTKTMSGLLAVFMAASFFAASKNMIRAYDQDTEEDQLRDFDYEADFDTVTYDADDGLLTSEVNAIAQTGDGYIWVGTYAGLYRYNGVHFDATNIDDRIRNVMCLFCDSKGRLWIGTNDSGLFCYDLEKEDVLTYDTSNGLSSNSIRTICEDDRGNIYIGTVMSMARIDENGNIKSFSEWKSIFHTVSLACMEDGSILGVTNSGTLFLVRNGLLLDTREYENGNNAYYLSVAASPDMILVSTTTTEIKKFEIKGDVLEEIGSFSIKDHAYLNNIEYSDTYKGFFYCAELGFGFIDPVTGTVSDMTEFGYRGSVGDVCVDDQSNIWFASNKHGVLKCSQTPFRYLYYRTDVEENVANAICECNGLLYIGLDQGITIINAKTRKVEYRPWQQDLKNERIRNILSDSNNNLWISTYGTNGLIKVDHSGALTVINDLNSDFSVGQARSAIELSDGRILVASKTGLFFLKDKEVVASLGEKDGLNNQLILSMVEREDGTILAASDGDGIYIIKNDRVIGHIGESEGLLSSVVLRIVKGTDGYFYVTSNAIFYDDGTSIRMLKNFPYSNNYDILISDDGVCWITSSAGLFVADEKSMVEDGEYTCTLLNKNWGLDTTFTANSWNLLIDDTLYLCCTDGIRSLSLKHISLSDSDYQIHLETIQAGNELYAKKDGKYTIPAINGRVSFSIAINNFTLTNPMIHYYLDGADDEGITCRQNEIVPLEYTNLAYGDYQLHVQVLNEATGEVEKEEVFRITKKAMMYERLYFRLYLVFVIVMLAAYIIWLFVTINRRAIKIRGLQKEMATDPMTGLYNKTASERILTKLCDEETGVLMMIDLDSFKLVNDIYGHDMGDRILIRFAELITAAVGEGNMGGRLGGDEFIGFVKDTLDEADVEEISRFLNREIVRSAKEFMGEDMNIPLGASIGAVRIPTDGRDFSMLFRYADKALYIVKQNGKHGYSFYRKGSDNNETDADGADKNNLSQIKKIISERNEGKGAFVVNFERLQVIYKFLNRDSRITGGKNSIIRFILEPSKDLELTDEIKDAFEEVLITNLKKNDIVSRYSGSFYAIFKDCDEEHYEKVVSRIKDKWNEDASHAKFLISTEVEEVE